jgi:hypothetical protein
MSAANQPSNFIDLAEIVEKQREQVMAALSQLEKVLKETSYASLRSQISGADRGLRGRLESLAQCLLRNADHL